MTKGHYKHSFDRILFGNRWLRPKHNKRGDWLIIGIYMKYFSSTEYEYLISFFGLECRIWMKREWIESQSKPILYSSDDYYNRPKLFEH